MKSKTLNLLLGTGLLGLSVYSLIQNSKIVDLRGQLEELASQSSVVADEFFEEKVPLVPSAPERVGDEWVQSELVVVAAENEPSVKRERIIEDFSAMMDNPQMNEMMRASQKGTLEVMYKDLLDQFEFSPEERSHFMDMLMARQMFRVETSMKMMGGKNTPEEMKLLGEEMKEYDQQVKAEIETFLNSEEDVGEFEFFEKTIAERMSLSGFKSKMAQANMPIESSQERQLLEIMADQKSRYAFTSDLNDDQNYNMGGDRFSGDNIDRFENDLINLHALIAEESRSVLEPDQLSALSESLEGMRTMQLSQLRMAANMFAPKKGE